MTKSVKCYQQIAAFLCDRLDGLHSNEHRVFLQFRPVDLGSFDDGLAGEADTHPTSEAGRVRKVCYLGDDHSSDSSASAI